MGSRFHGRWTRRELAAMLAAGMATSASAQKKRPPNILFLMTSEQRGDALGSMGHPMIRTSVVDLLAKNGGLLRNFYTAAPASKPARVSALTGRYPHTHGVTGNDGELSAKEVLLPQILSKQGYRTGLVGRLGAGEKDSNGLFDFVADDEEYRAFLREKHPSTNGDPGTAQLDTRAAYPWLWGQAVTPFADFPTQWVGDQAERFLTSTAQDDPWFLFAGFTAPAHPFVVPPPWDTRYPAERVSIPTLPIRRPTPATAEDDRTHYITRESQQILRQILRCYYGSISFIDEQLGRILGVLDDRGGIDDTIIVFTSDFGSNMGENGRMMGGTPTEGAMNVPGIIYYKPMLRPTIAEPVLDATCLVPTVLEMAGLPVPKGLDGVSIKRILTEENPEWSGAAYGELGFQTVRTDDWRLTMPGDHPTWEPELFDMRKDRLGKNNLYEAQEAAQVRNELEGILAKWSKHKSPAVKI